MFQDIVFISQQVDGPDTHFLITFIFSLLTWLYVM